MPQTCDRFSRKRASSSRCCRISSSDSSTRSSGAAVNSDTSSLSTSSFTSECMVVAAPASLYSLEVAIAKSKRLLTSATFARFHKFSIEALHALFPRLRCCFGCCRRVDRRWSWRRHTQLCELLQSGHCWRADHGRRRKIDARITRILQYRQCSGVDYNGAGEIVINLRPRLLPTRLQRMCIPHLVPRHTQRPTHSPHTTSPIPSMQAMLCP